MTDITVRILENIRDEIRGMRADFNERLGETNARLDQTNARLDRHERQLEALVTITSNIVTRMDDFRGGLADLRRRVDVLEQRVG